MNFNTRVLFSNKKFIYFFFTKNSKKSICLFIKKSYFIVWIAFFSYTDIDAGCLDDVADGNYDITGVHTEVFKKEKYSKQYFFVLWYI